MDLRNLYARGPTWNSKEGGTLVRTELCWKWTLPWRNGDSLKTGPGGNVGPGGTWIPEEPYWGLNAGGGRTVTLATTLSRYARRWYAGGDGPGLPAEVASLPPTVRENVAFCVAVALRWTVQPPVGTGGGPDPRGASRAEPAVCGAAWAEPALPGKRQRSRVIRTASVRAEPLEMLRFVIRGSLQSHPGSKISTPGPRPCALGAVRVSCGVCVLSLRGDPARAPGSSV